MSQALKILGLEHPVTEEEIKLRWRELCRTHHPDVGGDHDKFVLIMQAFREAMREAGTRTNKCEVCRGTGRVERHSGFFTTTMLCPECGGQNGGKKGV